MLMTETRRLALKAPVTGRAQEILTPEALAFVEALHVRFDTRRRELLTLRIARQAAWDAGHLPDFDPKTAEIREGDWTVGPIPDDLLDRRVEITGPVDRKMIINALNSGAKVFMADFEDATAPTWSNVLDGQVNLKDRWAGRLTHTDPVSGKAYALGDTPAVLIIRPRGWHLEERHLSFDGAPASGSLTDFGLYVFHNARAALAAGSGPYFYLPKLESGVEAALWDDVFRFAQETLGLPVGTIKATVLIETLPAAFQMHEILYALREHIVGLNCGRWDYIFSFIKRLGANPQFLTPDRSAMTMDKAFLRAYSRELIRTCHRRGAFAMGGMAAQIPVKGDEAANAAAFARVKADKLREVTDGHDGTWVAHPDLVPVARGVFDAHMPEQNQRLIGVNAPAATQADLLTVHEGQRTLGGLAENIRVSIQYIAAWLGGRGAVPLYNLMEDAATAEICRAQVWQWRHHAAALEDGTTVTADLIDQITADEMAQLGEFPHKAEAVALFRDLVQAERFTEFLTLPAYARLAG